MTGRFLIDVTDPRFFIPENADVVAFIRTANPFAHSDVGSLVFDAARQIDGARAYCPSASNLAYVVLHTAADRIVAIAYDMRSVAVRLSGPARAEAVAAGHSPAVAIGDDWVMIDPWRQQPDGASALDWMRRAYAEAVALER